MKLRTARRRSPLRAEVRQREAATEFPSMPVQPVTHRATPSRCRFLRSLHCRFTFIYHALAHRGRAETSFSWYCASSLASAIDWLLPGSSDKFDFTVSSLPDFVPHRTISVR